MSSFKEIVTKAVIGKAKKSTSNTHKIIPDESLNTVLGCWVINHAFSGIKGSNGTILINGSYDINVWYSYDQDKKTAVVNKNFTYSEAMNIPLKDNYNLNDASDILVRCLKQPTVSNVTINDNIIELNIEKEMGVEIVGDTKVKISVEDNFDDYDEIIDEVNASDININEEYLKDEKNI